MPIEVTITLLFQYPLPRAYQAVLMSGVALMGRSLLSLCRGGGARHTLLPTQKQLPSQQRGLVLVPRRERRWSRRWAARGLGSKPAPERARVCLPWGLRHASPSGWSIYMFVVVGAVAIMDTSVVLRNGGVDGGVRPGAVAVGRSMR